MSRVDLTVFVDGLRLAVRPASRDPHAKSSSTPIAQMEPGSTIVDLDIPYGFVLRLWRPSSWCDQRATLAHEEVAASDCSMWWGSGDVDRCGNVVALHGVGYGPEKCLVRATYALCDK